MQGFDILSVRILHTSFDGTLLHNFYSMHINLIYHTVPRVSLTAVVMVTNEVQKVACVCAMIISGTMTHEVVFQLLLLDGTAIGKEQCFVP